MNQGDKRTSSLLCSEALLGEIYASDTNSGLMSWRLVVELGRGEAEAEGENIACHVEDPRFNYH